MENWVHDDFILNKEFLMLFDMTVTPFIKSLTNLNTILDKAEAHATAKKIDMEVLLNTRLIADMLPMGRQIQIACDSAKLCASRLSGKDAPVNDDTEKTLADYKARINGTISYLRDFNAADFKGGETKHITQPRWEGKYLTGMEYAMEHAIPNVYFHVTMAYAILRMNGVEIGKKDYLGELPYKK
jgi:uncharacterized protein